MYSSNPFPELPSSPNVFLPPNLFFDHEKDCACFYYKDPFASEDCLIQAYNSLTPPIIKNNIKQDFLRPQQQFSEGQGLQSCEEHDDLLDSVISCSKKKTGASKKDGRSKIYTARGPRDRRVRLSIEISRKFFCLQDMLGFDKASKTLDWLLDKSKNAIKELVEDTNHCSSSCVTDQSKVVFLEAIKGGLDEDAKGKKKSVHRCVDGKRKKMTRNKTGCQENLVRELSRAMARARARERTRGKMQLKNLDDDELKTLFPDDFDCQNSKEIQKKIIGLSR